MKQLFRVIMMIESSPNNSIYIGCGGILAWFIVPVIYNATLGKRRTSKRLEEREKIENDLHVEYFNETLEKAIIGDPEFEYKLGECYFSGYGTDQNDEMGRHWLELAANHDYPASIFDYAKYCYYGMHGYSKNINKAFDLFQKAFILGVKDAKLYVEELKNKYHYYYTDDYSKKIMNLDESGLVDVKKFMQQCESEPERVLLTALIARGGLKPKGKILEGKFKLQPQANIQQYRADFLIDNWLAVEVDGKAFHLNHKSFVNDRVRDQHFLKLGITTFRAAASQVYKNPDSVALDIIKIAASKGK